MSWLKRLVGVRSRDTETPNFSPFSFLSHTKKDRVEEAKRHLEKVRDLNLLAEKLGCSLTQLSIAWSLKHEPVQCLLIGAKTTEQLTQSLQALQVRTSGLDEGLSIKLVFSFEFSFFRESQQGSDLV
jgi:aryl-alcohol dehydrogenase-like predicted oxidoreductase